MTTDTTPAGQTVTDANGHTLTVAELDPADMLDLIEAAGDCTGNAHWLRYSMTIASVREIDGVPVPFPSSKKQIKDLARRLTGAGISAASSALFAARRGTATDEDAADPELAAAKN